MITLKNDNVEISISETGAEMRKMTINGVDALWNGNPDVWSGVSPVLFPICGGLRDDKFTLSGKEYTLKKHGFARKMNFTVESKSAYSATFLLTDTEETLKQYPWHFELRITYSLIGKKVEIKYEIKNTSDNTMYASIGSHEAYACPEGIEDYDIIFPQNETLSSYELDGNLLAHKTNPIISETDTIALYYKYFAVDALVFKDVKSKSATLRNRKTGRSISVQFPDCNYLLLWTKPNADYICIEPWSGIPSMVDDGYSIEEKEGMEAISAGAVLKKSHTIYL